MARYKIWDKQSEIYTPSNERFTADEWTARYPWIKIPGAKMIITAGIINGGAAMEFESTKEFYKQHGALIMDDMTDAEVLEAIESFENNPPEPSEPTIEERTAAALEFLALSSLPDET